MTFIVLISNGDAHLKNWSLIYPDARIPTLSPAYDLVCTAPYRDDGKEDLGLKFAGSKKFEAVRIRAFARLETRLNAHHAMLAEIAADTIEQTRNAWAHHASLLDGSPNLQDSVSRSIEAHARTLYLA